MATIGGNANIAKIRVAIQSGDPSDPDADFGYLYIKADGLYVELPGSDVIGPLAKASAPSAPDYICIQDQKAQNTGGGTFTSGAWRTRDLNTEVSDDGGHASVASNQITLAAGTYICHIRCPAYIADRVQARLWNITDSALVLLGASVYSATVYTQNDSIIVGKFTLAAPKVLEVQHICTTTSATLGFGVASNFGTEIYTQVEFWKVA
ncbi:MAG: hypothetical protein IMZ61_03525 [Planctomycetes bacterium]|nr:hypothetical protein [Planctomycetota bacterium]